MLRSSPGTLYHDPSDTPSENPRANLGREYDPGLHDAFGSHCRAARGVVADARRIDVREDDRFTAACQSTGGTSSVKRPQFVRNISTGETGWFASPSLVDLNGDGKLEIVAPFYSTFVFDAKGRLLGKGTATKGRVYAPGVVADLDADKIPDLVVGGNEGTVAAYDFVGGKLRLKHGWPASTCSGGQCPEVRGMAAADLDGDGHIEVVVTTTNTSPTGSQVFVFDANGRRLAPEGRAGDVVAALQSADRRRERRQVQRRRQPRIRRLRRERRDRQPRRRSAARDRRHLRQPPDQRLQR